LTSHSLYL